MLPHDPHERKRFQFTLRTLILVQIGVMVTLVILGYFRDLATHSPALAILLLYGALTIIPCAYLGFIIRTKRKRDAFWPPYEVDVYLSRLSWIRVLQRLLNLRACIWCIDLMSPALEAGILTGLVFGLFFGVAPLFPIQSMSARLELLFLAPVAGAMIGAAWALFIAPLYVFFRYGPGTPRQRKPPDLMDSVSDSPEC